MSREQFLAHVSSRAGFRTQFEVEASVRAVLSALRRALCKADAKHIAAELPEWLAELMTTRSAQPVVSFIDDVAAQVALPAGFVREQAGVILAALRGELSPDGNILLDKALPSEVLELSRPREAPIAPPMRAHAHRTTRSLAGGQPGSRRPLSSSRPGSAFPLSEKTE
jgi:uncharacterized protein (DUF2267 family)